MRTSTGRDDRGHCPPPSAPARADQLGSAAIDVDDGRVLDARPSISALRFVAGFGVVSALADVVYEGARSAIGPYLGSLGAGAALVGLISGVGEAAALVLRLVTGRICDRTGRPWPQTVLGYAMTAVCVPLLAVGGGLLGATLLYTGERVGKAARTPARDTMLAHASAGMGRGRAFGLHEAVDQVGAVAGPVLVAATLAFGAPYRLAFALLAAPGAAALVVVGRLRRRAPDPSRWEPTVRPRTVAGSADPLDLSGDDPDALSVDDPAGAPAGAPADGGLADSNRPARRATAGALDLPPAFWRYAAFSAVTLLGFSTWAVLAVHLSQRHLVSSWAIPLLYALAMGCAAVAAVAFGRLYDRVGLRGLLALPVLAVAVPFLSFSDTPLLVVAGAIAWGIGMGVHDSTMRAAVADLVPADRRGAGYGTFTAVYGLAWLAGSALIGLLYEHGPGLAAGYVIVVQAAALALLASVLRRDAHR